MVFGEDGIQIETVPDDKCILFFKQYVFYEKMVLLRM